MKRDDEIYFFLPHKSHLYFSHAPDVKATVNVYNKRLPSSPSPSPAKS